MKKIENLENVLPSGPVGPIRLTGDSSTLAGLSGDTPIAITRSKYFVKDVMKYGYDIPIFTGDINDCQELCDNTDSCVGFQRRVSESPVKQAECFLKTGTIGSANGTTNGFVTYIKT